MRDIARNDNKAQVRALKALASNDAKLSDLRAEISINTPQNAPTIPPVRISADLWKNLRCVKDSKLTKELINAELELMNATKVYGTPKNAYANA